MFELLLQLHEFRPSPREQQLDHPSLELRRTAVHFAPRRIDAHNDPFHSISGKLGVPWSRVQRQADQIPLGAYRPEAAHRESSEAEAVLRPSRGPGTSDFGADPARPAKCARVECRGVFRAATVRCGDFHA
jgi:hypothetical protein